MCGFRPCVTRRWDSLARSPGTLPPAAESQLWTVNQSSPWRVCDRQRPTDLAPVRSILGKDSGAPRPERPSAHGTSFGSVHGMQVLLGSVPKSCCQDTCARRPSWLNCALIKMAKEEPNSARRVGSAAVRRGGTPQLSLSFPNRHGGLRPGAGRPRKSGGSSVPHRRRARLSRHHPAHVTLRIQKGLPSLRRKAFFRAVHRAFCDGCGRFGFRLVHYSIQSNHIHLIVEAPSTRILARALQGLTVRLARRLNAAMHRRGSVFSDRYHSRVLGTPLEVKNALRYVLNNAGRHSAASDRGVRLRGRVCSPKTRINPVCLDPYSSAVWFDGWQGTRGIPPAVFGMADARAAPLGCSDPRFLPDARPETAEARSHLLQSGWRRHGLIPIAAVPGPRPVK